MFVGMRAALFLAVLTPWAGACNPTPIAVARAAVPVSGALWNDAPMVETQWPRMPEAPTGAVAQHVIIVSEDGMRPDALLLADAPVHQRLIELVLTQQVAAGAFSNDDYAVLDSEKKSQIRVIGETASLPRHLLSVRRDLPAAAIASLKTTLLSMHQDRQGRSILEKLDGTTKFDPLPGGELAVSQRLLDVFYSPEKK